MTSTRLYHILISVCLTAILVSSCTSPEKNIRKGDAALAIGEYWEAANYYKKAYQYTPTKERDKRGNLAYRMAECYRKYGYTARALGSYRTAIRYQYTDTLTYYYEGEMARMQGDYRNAEKAYTKHLERYPDDENAKRGIRSCQLAATLREKGSSYTVKIDKFFNSNRTDFSPAIFPADNPKQIFFTTNRNAVVGDVLNGITGQKNGDIYTAKMDEKGKWKVAEAVSGGINTADDEGAPTFSPDGKTMYFTRCTVNPEYPRMAEIMSSARSDAAWGNPQIVKISNDTLSSYAHPAVSPDGGWLYFTSDMLGGEGGTDIWRGKLSGGSISMIENLGPTLNTAGNECFPSFRPSGELYFASDGREGMGGLDLYYAIEDTVTHKWKVTHLPYPMNSHGDDFGITFEGVHNRGYFSSNRSTGGRGWDKIYEFSHPENLITVKGWVYEQDGYELPSAEIFMVANDGTNQKFGVRTDGSFEQALTPGVDYLFLATNKGYLNSAAALHADSLDYEHQYTLQFPLASLSAPVLVRNVFYEFDKADITPESSEALDRLTAMLKENPHITIELGAHCDYRGSEAYNIHLSQRRAESVVNYLTEHGIERDRLVAHGYGFSTPKIVNRKLTETNKFLNEGDTLTIDYIKKLKEEEQEICNALNRRTEFRVLRTTYGLFDKKGRIIPEALKALTKRKKDANKSEDEDLDFEEEEFIPIEEILEEESI